MIQFAGKAIPDTLEEIVEPKRSALLVWDLQYDIAPRAFNYAEILGNLKSLIPSARKAGVLVIYSQQTPFELEHDKPVWIRRRMRMAKVNDPTKVPEVLIEGTRGWEIIDELKPQPGDVVFKKRKPSAFVGTDLDMILRNRDIGTVVLAGVSTEGGVEGSARHGLNIGYYMVIASDCVGSANREGHEQALKHMPTIFDVVDSKRLTSIWAKGK